jgi:glycerate kinase
VKVVLAPDSFKGTLSAPRVCDALAIGLRRVWPEARIEPCPMADGGEGTCDILVAASSGRHVTVPSCDPLGRPIEARIGLSGDGDTAFVETAAASGLMLLGEAERDPARTSTLGTGLLLTGGLDAGATRVILGIGGSATVDLGAGCLQALGVRFFDSVGEELPRGLPGGQLHRVARVEAGSLDTRWKSTDLRVACDVDNPLLGASGAAAVYGPQKGADPAGVQLLEAHLAHVAGVFEECLGVDLRLVPGAGAAGGLGAGLYAVCGAELCPGAKLIGEWVGLPAQLHGAGLVITGEGRLDAQTRFGKVVAWVAGLARRMSVPCVVVAGCVDPAGAELLCEVAGHVALSAEPIDLAHARQEGPRLLAEAAERLARSWSG